MLFSLVYLKIVESKLKRAVNKTQNKQRTDYEKKKRKVRTGKLPKSQIKIENKKNKKNKN